MAGLQGDATAVQRALKEQTYAANGALPPGAMPAKDERQVTCCIIVGVCTIKTKP